MSDNDLNRRELGVGWLRSEESPSKPYRRYTGHTCTIKKILEFQREYGLSDDEELSFVVFGFPPKDDGKKGPNLKIYVEPPQKPQERAPQPASQEEGNDEPQENCFS
jgi:hypothetical protein